MGADRKSFVSRLPGFLIVAGLLLMLVWIGLVGYRAYRLAQSFEELESYSQILTDNAVSEVDGEALESLIREVRNDFLHFQNGVGPLLALAPYLSWLPEIGPLIESSPHLMKMADSGSLAAVSLLEGLNPALVILQGEFGTGESSIPELLHVLRDASPLIADASRSVEEMRVAREELGDTKELPWRVRSLLDRFDEELPFLQEGLLLATVLPELLGANGQRTYLLMAQNEDELRATGGFISGAGLIVVENGQVVSVEFTDASKVDDWRNKPYDFPPQPFFEIMGMDIFLFRDVNFWPNFPTTAKAAMDLYSYGQGIPLDGVIAIDQHFLKILLDSAGPLFVPEIERTLTSENVISEMQAQWGPGDDSQGDWIAERKSFMGPMANALRLRIESDVSSINLLDLAQQLQSAAEQRHLQIYVNDPVAGASLFETGWDGHFANEEGQDYLLVVDTSMGFNKVSAAMDKEIRYHVMIPESGRAFANLEIEYTHNIEPSELECQHGTSYTNRISYSDLLDDCYWNYVRVYVPVGSELNGSTIIPVPAEQLLSGRRWDGHARVADESDIPFAVFDNFYLIRQGQQYTGEFRYELPESVIQQIDDGNRYTLRVAKQAGIGLLPFTLRVTLPPGAEFLSAKPEPSSVEGQDIIFSEIVLADTSYSIDFR